MYRRPRCHPFTPSGADACRDLRPIDKTRVFWDGRTALQAAAGHGSESILKVLLDQDTNVNAHAIQYVCAEAILYQQCGRSLQITRAKISHISSALVWPPGRGEAWALCPSTRGLPVIEERTRVSQPS